MSQKERRAWDERYSLGDRSGTAPDAFLLQLEAYRELLPAKVRALDVACGAGKNAVWLAAQGWRVTGCDVSLPGLRAAKQLATERGVGLDLFCLDLDTPPRCPARFDLIVCFFFLDRNLFAWFREALAPGGIIVYKTYTVDQLRFPGRSRHREHLLEHQELLTHFRDFRVLCYQEIVEGQGVAQLIAQKPAAPRP